MALTAEMRQKVVENNRKITELLNENEGILREAGYNPPVENYVLERAERIGFPSGYIRTVSTFIKKYHLMEVCPNKKHRHNIAYALAESDLINYILNRINVWGSVEILLYKLAIVNLVSIMEAIILEAANNICCNASACGKTTKCATHFSYQERERARNALDKLVLLNILEFEAEKVERIKEIMDLRNQVHIRLAPKNELDARYFTLDLYNEVVELLQDIDERIFLQGVSLYANCCK